MPPLLLGVENTASETRPRCPLWLKRARNRNRCSCRAPPPVSDAAGPEAPLAVATTTVAVTAVAAAAVDTSVAETEGAQSYLRRSESVVCGRQLGLQVGAGLSRRAELIGGVPFDVVVVLEQGPERGL